MLEDERGPQTWRLHTRLCDFVRNISTNISALGQRTQLKLGGLSSLFIVYNITIFWLCPLHSFWFYFLLRDTVTHSTLRSNDWVRARFTHFRWLPVTFPFHHTKFPPSTSFTQAIPVLRPIILPLQTFFSRVLLLRQQAFSCLHVSLRMRKFD